MTDAMPGLTRVVLWRPNLELRGLADSVALVFICLVPIVLYLPFAGAPFERDEGVYGTIAQGLLDGNVPYRDLFDNKPPLVYGWYAFSFLLFGESVVAPRLVAAALLSLTTLAIFGQARMLFSRKVAYVAAACFAVSTGLPFVALHANTEAYMLLPLVGSLCCFTLGMRSTRLRWFLLAGALGGVAIMTKQVAVWNLLALAVMAVAWRWRTPAPCRTRLAPLGSLLVGAFVTLALIATPFFAVGALDELVYANISYNRLYVGALTWGDRVINLTQGGLFVFAVAAPLIAAAALGLRSLLGTRLRAVDYLLIGWALASALGVLTGGRFFPHYFLHLLPAAALLASLLVRGHVRRRFGGAAVRLSIGIGALLVGLSLATNGLMYLAPWRTEQRVAPAVFTQKQWEEQSRVLGVYIAERTNPDDKVFNLGRESQIYFYAQRSPAVTYFYDWAYQYDERTLAPTIAALEQAKPIYIIDTLQPPLFAPEARPPGFSDFLASHYEYEGRLYFADVYRLKARRE